MSLLYDCSDPQDRTDGLSAAAGAIRRGDLIVMPTDTVYGVACDAFSIAGVDALFRAKGRGRNMPSPVLVGSWSGLDGLVIMVDPVARELIEAFWPGGLTIIVEHAPSLEWDLGETRGTVAVRMPAHPVAIDLLTETGPLAVSSGNRTGQAPPQTAAEAREQLGDDISVYLEAGASEGVPSTIVDLTGEHPVLRRVGAVSAEALREIAGDLVIPEELQESAGIKSSPSTSDVTMPAPEAAGDAQSAEATEATEPVADTGAPEEAEPATAPEPADEAPAVTETAAVTEEAVQATPVTVTDTAGTEETAADAPTTAGPAGTAEQKTEERAEERAEEKTGEKASGE